MAGRLIGIALAAALSLAPSAGAETITFRIPLEDGRFEVRDMLEAMSRAAGMDVGDRFEAVTWSIDVGTTLGRLQLKVFDRIAPNAVTTEIEPDAVVVHVDREAFALQVEEMIDRVERWAAGSATPDDIRFGMTVATSDDPRAPLDTLPPGTSRVVMLVHGLDDPGWLWRDMAPALRKQGHVVLRFEYPNDQAVIDSTDMLAMELAMLHRAGVRHVDIVAHSMGGLVSRDVLTRRAYYNSDGSGGDRLPRIGRLIMIGTPNHGAPIARLRGVSEVGELISRWISGQGEWRDALADGAGEAGRDLLPDSDFLRRLNRRPRPVGTTYTIVAGQVSPVSEAEVDAMLDRLRRLSGSDRSVGFNAASRALQAMVNGLGDGIVSTQSARLEGVDDFVTVGADHIGLIVNVFPSDDVPPAIPIVVERLEESPNG